MKKKIPDDSSSTLVVRMGIDSFTTTETYLNQMTDTEVDSGSSDQTMEIKKKQKEGKSGRFYKFVKKHFLTRKGGPTNVQEIHILPEGDDLKWARRSAGSAASRSSEGTTTSEEEQLEVVHDMAEEYIPETL